MLAVAACASTPPPTAKPDPEPAVIDGVRQQPLTESEVAASINQQQRRISDCYARERLNAAGPLSDFEIRLKIPVDGSAPKGQVVRASIPGQMMLESCVVDTLTSLRFPAHNGATLVIDVPISGPGT
jgi:hypothetical protein